MTTSWWSRRRRLLHSPPTDRNLSPEAWLLSAAACVAGPGMAVLYESDVFALGPSATLWPIGFVAGAAAVGLVTGLRIGARASRALGAVVAILNGLVLAFYGFFLLFFGLGGSR